MKVIKSVPVYEGKFIRMLNKHVLTDNGNEIIWESVERTNIHNRGAVVIVAVTKQGEMLFERNWRAPSEGWVIQFPAGLTDVRGEGEQETAKRELLEETGYKADRLIPVIASPLSPDLTPTVAMHFFAPDVEFVSEPHRDLAEKIELIRVPLENVSKFLTELSPDTSLDLRVTGVLWVMEKLKMISPG